jgi:hypothetical protein
VVGVGVVTDTGGDVVVVGAFVVVVGALVVVVGAIVVVGDAVVVETGEVVSQLRLFEPVQPVGAGVVTSTGGEVVVQVMQVGHVPVRLLLKTVTTPHRHGEHVVAGGDVGGAGVGAGVEVHVLQTGQPVLLAAVVIVPHGQVAQPSTEPRAQFFLQVLHVEPAGIIKPQGQFAGTGGHVGLEVVVVAGQLIRHLLQVEPAGIMTPHGQFVGAGGHAALTYETKASTRSDKSCFCIFFFVVVLWFCTNFA